jgi:Ca2+-binding RTX toxin-like protein
VARQKRNNKARVGVLASAAAAVLLALPGSASAAVSSSVAGGVLSVASDAGDAGDAGDAITITSAGGDVKVNGADPTGGPFDSSSITAIEVTGDPGANDINLAGVTGADFTALTSVEVDGGAGNDTINGSQLADDLSGGDGNDRIVGDDNPAGTRDESLGQAGDDTLVWNPGDDDDLNEGGDGNDTIEVNGGGKEQFEVKPSVTPGRVAFDRVQPDPTFGAPFSVDIGTSEKLDLNAGAGDDSLNAAGPVSGLAGWTIDADGGDGNDTLAGGSEAVDVLAGGAGADTLRSRDQSADSVVCGTEIDSVTADAQDSVNADCENVDRGQGQGGGQPPAQDPPAQDPPAEDAPAQDTLAPAVEVSRKAVSVNRKRIGGIRVTCPADEQSCDVTVQLRRKGKALGRKTIALDGGESKVVKIKLSRKAFALLEERGRLRVKAVVTAEDGAGNERKRVLSLTLKRR